MQDDKTGSQTTIEQQAWRIVHEAGPAWWNEYARQFPNSAASEHDKRYLMAHYCVVEALRECANAK